MRRDSGELLAEYKQRPGFADREREAEAMVLTAIALGRDIEAAELARTLGFPEIEGLGATCAWLGRLWAKHRLPKLKLVAKSSERPS